MTTQPISSVPADVADFVVQVRAALADLPADDVDELTAGLAADLADARAESPQAWREGVGSPAAYAAELRAAAGLPPAGPSVPPERSDALQQWWRDVTSSPAAARVQEEAHDLAPAWWVIRGAIGGLLINHLFLGLDLLNPVTIVITVLGAAISVWLGRNLRRGAGSGWRIVSAACTALAILVGFVMVSNVGDRTGGSYVDSGPYVSEDLSNGGEPVTNLYGFDADGNRVDGLRLFDQAGRQLKVTDFDGAEVTTFPTTGWLTPPNQEYGLTWTPPMTLPSVGSLGTGAETSSESSTSTSDPTSSTSESSSSSSSSGSSKGKAPERTSSPRSTD